jgi:SAM-dependent methyltransferase
MEQLKSLITETIQNKTLTEATLSNLRKSDPTTFNKVVIKPVELKGEFLYQFSYYYDKKVLHENRDLGDTEQELASLFEETFKQGFIHTKDADFQILISKKFKVSILKKKATKPELEVSHNRKKKYILEDGIPIPYLIELGVMSKEGKVLAKKYDKFRQINRFLEMVSDIIPHLKRDKPLNIVDFGCGKSYLTFALYHYLKEIEGLQINVIGLDLKEDVIQHCNLLVERFNFENLRFLVGDIAQYNELDYVDMVVTLHACDTATDAALEKAVRWEADVILSVPCCQHELFKQVENRVLEPLLGHGILKERFSALATDAIRAKILDIVGYRTQILEFIDMEHTPKNLLIRAVKGNSTDHTKNVKEYLEFKQFLGISPYLEEALSDKLKPLLPS